MTRAPKDIGGSVRTRLLRLARERGEDFQLLLTRYVTEWFLYRLSKSRHADQLVPKSAALFALWTGRPHRATRDPDLLGLGDPQGLPQAGWQEQDASDLSFLNQNLKILTCLFSPASSRSRQGRPPGGSARSS
jgi:hypothetical protein